MIGWLRDRLFGSDGSDATASDGDSGSDDEGSVWDLTPDWQVGAYRLQGASAPRDEQQEAVREVRERASRMERELDDR